MSENIEGSKLLQQSVNFQFICLKCREPIADGSRYSNVCDRCITCAVCGEEMQLTGQPVGVPAKTDCRACGYRVRAEADRIESERIHKELAEATALLLDGPGDATDREAALKIVEDYYYGLGCS